MSIVHSCDDTQTAKRVSGGLPGRFSRRQMLLRRGRGAAPPAGGTDLSGISTPCVPSIAVRNSRKTTGSPSVTK